MDAAETPSLRRLLVRGAATLLALVGLYVLSVGPAAYVAAKSHRVTKVFERLYMPLWLAAGYADLGKQYNAYVGWWAGLAGVDEIQ